MATLSPTFIFDEGVVETKKKCGQKTSLQPITKYSSSNSSNSSVSSSSSANVVMSFSDGREGAAPQEEAIPAIYVDTIKAGFGENPDIFGEILRVTPTTPNRDVRISYFRRGREILAEEGVRGLDQAASVGDVSSQSRTRFQAVSMAYEIVSKPGWREYYMKHGLVSNEDATSVCSNDPAFSSAASLPPPSKPVVRWNEHVEELVFERTPDEHALISPNPLKPVRRKRKKKKKAKILVATDELDKHLKQLDSEAKQSFVADWWDSLEESIDGLLKLAVEGEKKKGTSSRQRDENRSQSSGPLSSTRSSTATGDDMPFDEDRDDEYLDEPGPIVMTKPNVGGLATDEESRKHSRGPGETSPTSVVLSAGEISTRTAQPSKSSKSVDDGSQWDTFDVPSPFRPASPDPSADGSTKSEENEEMFDVGSISFSILDNSSKMTDSDRTPDPSRAIKRTSLSSEEMVDEKSIRSNLEDDVFAGLDDDASTKASNKSLSRTKNTTSAATLVRSQDGADISVDTETTDKTNNTTTTNAETRKNLCLASMRQATKNLSDMDAQEMADATAAAPTTISTTSSYEVDDDNLNDSTMGTNCETFCSNVALAGSLGFGNCPKPSSSSTEGTNDDDGTSANNSRSRSTRSNPNEVSVESKDVDSKNGTDGNENNDDVNDKSNDSTLENSDGFVEYLVAYITALLGDCAQNLSNVDWEDSALGAFMIEDGEVKGMLCTIEREMKLASTLNDHASRRHDVEGFDPLQSFG